MQGRFDTLTFGPVDACPDVSEQLPVLTDPGSTEILDQVILAIRRPHPILDLVAIPRFYGSEIAHQTGTILRVRRGLPAGTELIIQGLPRELEPLTIEKSPAA